MVPSLNPAPVNDVVTLKGATFSASWLRWIQQLQSIVQSLIALNASQSISGGRATLVAGTAVVSNTSVTANSRIMLTAQSLGTVTTPTALAVTARSAGVSFTITSASALDTSVVAYEIFEPV